MYTDSTALVKTADEITKKFTSDVKKINPELNFKVKVLKNTTPFLIYVDKGIINLPFWDEVIQPQKDFFTEVAGGEAEGKEVFGLFFNGFYLVHEIGHALSDAMGKKHNNAYDSEYAANVTGILYWEKAGENAKLKQCYHYAKKMLLTLKNPVPQGEDYKTYMTKHYDELSSDPYSYGYIQFSQFVEIFESKHLPGFDEYLKNGMNM